MAEALALFGPRFKWCTPEFELTREAQMFVRGLWLRSGGAFTDGADVGSVSTVANEALARVTMASPQPAMSFSNGQTLQEARIFMPRTDVAQLRPDDASHVIAARVFSA